VTLSPRDVSKLLSRYGLRPSRALGQNFVADPNTVRRVARLAGVGLGDAVVEIGPGLGCLTLALIETGAEVVGVEADRHLLPVLDEVVGERARIVHADALSADWDGLLDPGREWALVANLPYNVATSLVLRLLEGVPQVARMLVMVQREVGERWAAGPGDAAYGAVSVKVAYRARAQVVGRVPPAVFVPRPRVESVLVEVRRRPEPAVDPSWVGADRLFEVVGAGFSTRRKMLRNSLAGVVAPEAFAAAGVDPSARAEELGLAEWGRLAAGCGPATGAGGAA
jgi:16S rRNA (adenine1518-N6/adenine1519-N6)-dimethyltransferase